MEYEWVMGKYEGDKAHYIIGLANDGLGYFIRSIEGAGKGMRAEVAFKRPMDSLRHGALELAPPYAIPKLDELYARRHGSR